ncbi:MAG: hypothetical protein IJS50_01590, partial [Desulfovibrio sp.]|nr:hypothetical protein [Desulfovibrio sp.]
MNFTAKSFIQNMGGSMDFYFAGLKEHFFMTLLDVNYEINDLNVLVSMKDMTPSLSNLVLTLKKKGFINKIALDSGTFSLNNKNCKISDRHLFFRLLEYGMVHANDFDLIFNFDRSFKPSGFNENLEYQIMLSGAWIPVIPVSHDIVHADYDK